MCLCAKNKHFQWISIKRYKKVDLISNIYIKNNLLYPKINFIKVFANQISHQILHESMLRHSKKCTDFII